MVCVTPVSPAAAGPVVPVAIGAGLLALHWLSHGTATTSRAEDVWAAYSFPVDVAAVVLAIGSAARGLRALVSADGTAAELFARLYGLVNRRALVDRPVHVV